VKPGPAGLLSGVLCGLIAALIALSFYVIVYPQGLTEIASFIVEKSEGLIGLEDAKTLLIISFFTNNIFLFMLVGFIGGIIYERKRQALPGKTPFEKSAYLGFLIGIILGSFNFAFQIMIFGFNVGFFINVVLLIVLWTLYGVVLHKLTGGRAV